VTLPGVQKVVGPLAVMAALGTGLTVTVNGAEVPLQEPFDTVTLYVPEAATVMDCVCAPVDQR
jgi:hypothetical protein